MILISHHQNRRNNLHTLKFLGILAFLTLSLSAFISFGASNTNSKLDSKVIEYGKDKIYSGYLTMPKAANSKTPSLVLIHNWMGVTEETQKQADRFAALGYRVFAVDVYGKGIRPKDATEAGKLATELKLNRKELRLRLAMGLEKLVSLENVDSNKIGVVGYCFGGTAAIELARAGTNLKGVVSFHGGLDSPTPTDGKNIKAKILALHGALDPYVAKADIAAFEEEMKKNAINYKFISYPNAVHSFTEVGAGSDIKKGAAYNPEADKKSFEAAKDFLAETL